MDNGVSIKQVLTQQVLEFLYACAASTLMKNNVLKSGMVFFAVVVFSLLFF